MSDTTGNDEARREREAVAKEEMELGGFSIAPKHDCPHVASDSFVPNPELVQVGGGNDDGKQSSRDLFSEKARCKECGDIEETWICLRCGMSGCGRYRQGHMLQHAADMSAQSCAPVIAMSLADLSAWCFACDEYITHPKLELPFRALHRAKFGLYPSSSLHSFIQLSTG